MMLDKQNLLSDKQVLTVTANSTNVLDTGTGATVPGGYLASYGTALHDLGRGNKVEVFVQVDGTFVGSGGTSVQVALVTSASSTLSSPTTLYTSAAIGVANLPAGYRFRIGGPIPPGTLQQYIGLTYTLSGTFTPTVAIPCTVTAGVVETADTNYAPL